MISYFNNYIFWAATIERQRLHTAVSFNNSEFLRWGPRYDPSKEEESLSTSEKILQRISVGGLLMGGPTKLGTLEVEIIFPQRNA